MPTCRKCQTYFPNRMLIDGKQRHIQNRVFCLNCSPFGAQHNKDNTSTTSRLCANCQKETTNPKYCSKSCAAKISNKTHPKRKRSKEYNACIKCGITIGWRRTYCETCHPQYKDWSEVTLGVTYNLCEAIKLILAFEI